MSYMSELDIEIREMLKNNKDVIGLENCIKDLAVRYNVSYEQMSLYVEELMGEESNGGMTFAGNKDISSSYVEKRFKGEDK